MTTFYDLPLPSADALTKSTALSDSIQKEIERQRGFISFSRFMELALYHPQWGYYQTHPFHFGAEGDFTTASEISPLYAQCFARQCLPLLSLLPRKQVLELGAGSGLFAKDLLSELAKHHQLPERYFIFEISASLRKKQFELLKSTCPQWIERIHWLDELPAEWTGIVIANEVLDALPVHCFHIEKKIIQERLVTYHQGEFSWHTGKPLAQNTAEKLQALHERYFFAEGYESEINLNLPTLLQALSSSLSCGFLVFADYGYGQREFYHPERSQGTLTCFYSHKKHHHPLIMPGLQDLTAHVDFTHLAESAIDAGFELQAFTSQSAFLLANGLIDLAAEIEKHSKPVEAFHLHQAIKTLTLPTEMGERIKMMIFSKNLEITLPTFRFQDRRRELSF